MRSIDKPLLRADPQRRVVTTVSNRRRLNEGRSALLAQYDEPPQARAEAAQAQALAVQARAEAMRRARQQDEP